MEQSQTDIIEVLNWRVRYRGMNIHGSHQVILMLHGWTGDENSMWIFAPRLPQQAILIAPRGPYPTQMGGFGWQPNLREEWPSIEDFQPAVDKLTDMLAQGNFPGADLTKMNLLGFSQGAALAFSFAILKPEIVQTMGSLSGFLPIDADKWLTNQMYEKPIFIAHGALDDLVPVSRARKSAEILEKSGAKVVYCEDNVGHKLSASCFRSMEAFYRRHL